MGKTANPFKPEKGMMHVTKVIAYHGHDGHTHYKIKGIGTDEIEVNPNIDAQIFQDMLALRPDIKDLRKESGSSKMLELNPAWDVKWEREIRVAESGNRNMMIARQIKPCEPVVIDLPPWANGDEKMLTKLHGETNTGSAFVDKVLGLPRSGWPDYITCVEKINAAIVKPPERNRPKVVENAPADTLDEHFGPREAKRWSALDAKDIVGQGIASEKHFKRELLLIDPHANPGKEMRAALEMELGLYIAKHGIVKTVETLQARLDYLKEKPVDIISEQGEDDVLNEIVAEEIDPNYEPELADKPVTPAPHWSTKTENMATIRDNLIPMAIDLNIPPTEILVEALATLGLDDWAKYPGRGADALRDVKAKWQAKINEKATPSPSTQSTEATEPPKQEQAAQPPKSTANDVIDGEVVEPPSRALSTVDQSTGEITVFDPRRALDMIKAKVALVNAIHKEILVKDVDYGKVPGTDKDTLLKPGAEKLLMGFDFYPIFKATDQAIADWKSGLFQYEYECVIYNRATGRIEGSGIGNCNSMEKKYHWRQAERKCPNCGKENIRKSKEAGKGYYCWTKTDGCGATFGENDPAIINQVVGRVENPDIFDLVNTMSKMAQKRALVAATLNATGASAVFTQDVEDFKDFGMLDSAA